MKEVTQGQIAVLAFAFGSPSAIGPNWFLANAAKSLIEHGSAGKILTQKEIGLGYMPEDVVYFIGDEPLAEPTLRIAWWGVAIAKEMGVRTIIIVAADPHIKRCLRDAKYAVKKTGASIFIGDYRRHPEEVIGDHSSMVWFCPGSKQSRTRSALAWWTREGLLRAVPMFIYTQIAG